MKKEKQKKRMFGPDHGKTVRFSVKCAIFRRDVRFRFNVTKEKMLKEVESLGLGVHLDGLSGAHFAIPLSTGETVSYVWIPKFFNDIGTLEILAHETLHAAVDILASVEIPYERKMNHHTGDHEGSEEVLNYLFGWLFFEALKNSRLKE